VAIVGHLCKRTFIVPNMSMNRFFTFYVFSSFENMDFLHMAAWFYLDLHISMYSFENMDFLHMAAWFNLDLHISMYFYISYVTTLEMRNVLETPCSFK